MVDNFDKIIPMMEFPNPNDSFYFIQIIERGKDHFVGSNSRLIKSYHVSSVNKLEIYKDEMIKLANLFDARVYINLNPRSFKKAAFHTLSKIAHQMENSDFAGVRKAYNSVCGHYHAEMDKRWLVDIDDVDIDNDLVFKIIDLIKTLHLNSGKDYKIIGTLKTKNGCHVITNPFNLKEFHSEFPKIHVHKNNPTILYAT